MVLTVYVLDGALFESSMRHFRAGHALFYDRVWGAEHGDEKNLLQLLGVVVGIKCGCHALSNAVKWGLMTFAEDNTSEEA